MNVSLGFGIIFTLVLTLLFYLYYHNSTHANNLDQRGRVTEAEIKRKFEESSTASTTTASSSSGRFHESGPTSYLVEYEYETQDGQIILETENVGKKYQEAMEIGEFYDVKYDPEDPEISTIYDINGYERGARTLKILITIFSILSLISWWVYLKK